MVLSAMKKIILLLILLKISNVFIFAQPKENLSFYLKSTYFIDSGNFGITQKAMELIRECKTDSDKVKAL